MVGWIGLIWLIQNTEPYIWPRWFFFFFMTLAVSGLALPLSTWLNLRFPSDPPAGVAVITRQASWFGVYGCVLAWLQLGRALTTFTAVAIGVGFILIEAFIRIREKSLWMPKDDENA